MAIKARYFGEDFNFDDRFFPNPEVLAAEVVSLKQQRLTVVLTMGSFDMLHIGHCRYLNEAKKLGNVLVVGVETDAKVRRRKKGGLRPVVPEIERYEMLVHTRYVDLLTVKDDSQPKWHLIKLVRPDVLQAVDGTYTAEELEQLKEFCGKVVVQGRQAETSTSAKIRLLAIAGMGDLATKVTEMLPAYLAAALAELIPQAVQKAFDELKEAA